MSTPPPPPADDAAQQLAADEQMHRAMRAYVEAIRPAINQVGQQLATLAAAAEEAGSASRDDYGLAPPLAPQDRPARQSPYGPPRRH